MSSSLKITLTLVFFLLLLWVALTGSVKADSILVGLALSLLITFVTWKPLFSGSRHIYVHDPEALNFRPLKALMALPGFIADLTKASAEVAILAIKPSIKLRPGIVRVHSHLKNKTTIVFLANYITLTPGTLTVDMDISRRPGVLASHGGAAREMPVTFMLFLVGALGISGCPGFSGFASKAMIKAALYEVPNPAWYWILQAAGVGTVISFCKVGFFAFVREPVQRPGPLGEQIPGGRKDSFRNLGMLLPAAATVALGIMPGFFTRLGGFYGSNLFGIKNLLPAMVTLALGLFIFRLFRRWFEPGSNDIPDVSDIFATASDLSAPLYGLLFSMNCGLLRFYIAAVIAAVVVLFLFL